MKQNKVYGMINILILFLTVALFIYRHLGIQTIWNNKSIWIFIILVITAIIVHGIKAFRLYFVLYGKNISFGQHLRQYCKVIPVSVILPFKLGDIFRAYCYGYHIGNYFSGIIIILLDRFADTLALTSMIFLINILNGMNFTLIFYMLLFFLVCVIICYLIFPQMYHYWKRYFLKSKASKRKNNILKLLEKSNRAYSEIAIVVKGRCTILYILSFIAWMVEIGGLVISNKIVVYSETEMIVSEYLTSALLGAESIYLNQFILISVLLLLILYIILYAAGLMNRRDKKKC